MGIPIRWCDVCANAQKNIKNPIGVHGPIAVMTNLGSFEAKSITDMILSWMVGDRFTVSIVDSTSGHILLWIRTMRSYVWEIQLFSINCV